jgi:hypothetical protein
MEQRGVLLSGIARVLNAGGSALVTVYDVTASALGKALPGEREKLRGEIRACEKNMERLYYQIGKEVSKQGDMTQISRAAEAGVKLVAEYRTEIEKIKQRIGEIEAAERLEREHLLEEREAARGMRRQQEEKQAVIVSEEAAPRREVEEETYAAETQPVVIPKPSGPEAPVASEVSTGAATGEGGGVSAEIPETEKEGPHKYSTEELGNMLKVDLLALCKEKGIEADRRMKKAEIIELILG